MLWLFTTTGGQQIFVSEVLGGAYDSQAEHFLHGNVDVDVEAIRHEAMIVNDHVRMYFGPFPALLRIPLNFVYPAGSGQWSRISGFCAATVAMFAFAGLLQMALQSSPLSLRARNWLGNACVVGFAFGSPLLLLLGNLSIYDEAIVWAFGLSLAAIFFVFRARQSEGLAVTSALVGFSFCAGGAFLSRGTFGIPFFLVALFLVPAVIRQNNKTVNLFALLLPLGAALIFYVWLSYARFGSITGVNFDYYINPVHAEFARKFGVFSPRRIASSFADYFTFVLPSVHTGPPFLAANRHSYDYPSLYSNDFSEVYLPVTWCSPWLIFGAIMGIICLVRRDGAAGFHRAVAIALLMQFICILSFFALAQRYAVDLYPFLIFCFVMFLSSGGAALVRTRRLIVGLVVLSVIVNSLATVSWLVDADQNVPTETKAAWKRLLGRD
ncbi:MAG TPA: hypothetical protein VFQ78_03260 [Candidatus Udaeobacter sp.]|nr:hypothetical protein [Candidatus Udaeobacter sp.]